MTLKPLFTLPLADWLALTCFIVLWVGYALFAKSRGQKKLSLLATTNRYRMRWMEQATFRDPRMVDGVINNSLSNTPSFFSSTSIFIIGGLMAMLGTTSRTVDVVREIPFAQDVSAQLLEIKILSLIAIFVYAFFRFSWSMRQYTFVSLLIGAMPTPQDFAAGKVNRAEYIHRAGLMVGCAAETFNDGLRAYYFAFAALAWFFSPWAMILCTILIVGILYGREFHSQVLDILRAPAEATHPPTP